MGTVWSWWRQNTAALGFLIQVTEINQNDGAPVKGRNPEVFKLNPGLPVSICGVPALLKLLSSSLFQSFLSDPRLCWNTSTWRVWTKTVAMRPQWRPFLRKLSMVSIWSRGLLISAKVRSMVLLGGFHRTTSIASISRAFWHMASKRIEKPSMWNSMRAWTTKQGWRFIFGALGLSTDKPKYLLSRAFWQWFTTWMLVQLSRSLIIHGIFFTCFDNQLFS